MCYLRLCDGTLEVQPAYLASRCSVEDRRMDRDEFPTLAPKDIELSRVGLVPNGAILPLLRHRRHRESSRHQSDSGAHDSQNGPQSAHCRSPVEGMPGG